MAKRSSHGTLLHVSLQRFQLNHCYSHQDLHYALFHPASRPRLCQITHTPSYTLRNQPASMAPVRPAASASSIFKTGNLGECVSGRSLAGADFHGHSLSVKSRRASLRCLGERRIRRRTGRVRFIPHRQSSLPGRPTYRDHSSKGAGSCVATTARRIHL